MSSIENDGTAIVVDKTKAIPEDAYKKMKETQIDLKEVESLKASVRSSERITYTTEKEANDFVNKVENTYELKDILNKKTGEKNYGGFIKELIGKFPLSFGNDLKDYNRVQGEEALGDIMTEALMRKIIEYYKKSDYYIITDGGISFSLKGGGTIALPVAFEARAKTVKKVRSYSKDLKDGGLNEANQLKELSLDNEAQDEEGGEADFERVEMMEKRLAVFEHLKSPDEVLKTLKKITNLPEANIRILDQPLAKISNLWLNAHIDEKGNIDLDEQTRSELLKHREELLTIIKDDFGEQEQWDRSVSKDMSTIAEIFMLD